jgi:hypothetical protein
MKFSFYVCAAAAMVAGVIVLAGCGGSFCVGDGCTVSGDDVAKEAQSSLNPVIQKQAGQDLPPVSCPGDIDNEVGATMHCTSTGEFNGKEQTLGIDVKVKSVDEDSETTNFDFVTTGFE